MLEKEEKKRICEITKSKVFKNVNVLILHNSIHLKANFLIKHLCGWECVWVLKDLKKRYTKTTQRR